jgi:superfamily II DNA or RNA helicase
LIKFSYNKKTNKLQIHGDKDVFDEMREYFSVEDPNASFIRRHNKFTKTRKYLITPMGKCDLGLYWDFIQYLTENHNKTQIITDSSLDFITNQRDITEIYNNFTHSLREYQDDVVRLALKQGTGVYIMGTGAGKTLTTAALIENEYRFSNNPQTFKCLVIVPDLGLVTQTYDEFIKEGVTFSLSKWTGKIDFDENAQVIICNSGVLHSRFKDNPWILYVDMVVVDECHKIKHDNKVSGIISKIKTTKKYGFTGTLPEEQFEKWSIIGKLGPVMYEKTSSELRQEKYLVNASVKMLNLVYNERVPQKTTNKYRNELDFLYNNTKRNNLIHTITSKLPNNTLVLVNHIEHGENLYNTMFFNNTKQVFFIRGSVEVDEREKVKQIMEQCDNVVCIAISAIFSTGINIKNLHNIVIAAGGKSFIRLVQSIGRGLRLHENKNRLCIIDLSDELRYSQTHSMKRENIYIKEDIPITKHTIQLK